MNGCFFCVCVVETKTGSTQMGRMMIVAAVLLLSVTGTLGHVIVRGPLHEAMLVGLKEHPSIRKVTVVNPYQSFSRRYRKPPTCEWEMDAFIVGDYAIDKAMMHLNPNDCSQYTAAQWSNMLPCVFTREDMMTRCKGPLPDNANNTKWTIGYAVVHPFNMKLPRKPAAVSKNLTAVSFVAEPNLLSMVGLGLAKTIQISAQYSGSGVVTSSGYGDTIIFLFSSKTIQFWLELKLPMYTEEKYKEVNISWTAWPESDRLVIDMHASWLSESLDYLSVDDDDLLKNRRKRSLSSPVLTAASSISTLVLNTALRNLRSMAPLKARLAALGALIQQQIDLISGNNTATEAPESTSLPPTPNASTDEPTAETPTIITANTVVSYSKNDLGASSISVDGKIYSLTYVPPLRIIELEPRLCPDLSLSVACGIMYDIDSDEAQRLRIGGNVTSFYLRDLTRCRRGGQNYVCTKGNVIGTTGLLVDVQYKSAVLDSDDPAWTELPIESLSRCAQRVHRMTECKPPQELRSFSGQQRSEKRGVLHNF